MNETSKMSDHPTMNRIDHIKESAETNDEHSISQMKQNTVSEE